jgi:hypothetical protein
MSEQKQFDNKQLVHIGCEVVALLGVSYYFSSKNKTLQSHIEELCQKLEEQEDKILKLEETMKSSMNMAFNQINGIVNILNKQQAVEPQARKAPTPIIKIVKPVNTSQSPPSREVKPNHANPEVNPEVKNEISQFINNDLLPPIKEENPENNEEQDNDEDIQEELSELESGLKKE